VLFVSLSVFSQFILKFHIPVRASRRRFGQAEPPAVSAQKFDTCRRRSLLGSGDEIYSLLENAAAQEQCPESSAGA